MKEERHEKGKGKEGEIRVRPQRLVGLVSILVDILLYVERLPERGGDGLAQHTLMTSGGGLNILVDAARLGMPVAYAGRVGDGPMGKQISADLDAAGILRLLPPVAGEDSGFDIGLIESDAERTFVTAPGTESRLREADVAGLHLLAGDAVCISGYDLCYPISGQTLERWLPGLDNHVLLVLDPGPLADKIPPARLASILARTDLLSLNAREAHLLTGSSDLSTAAQQLLARIAPGGLVVARAGAEGCWLAFRHRGQEVRHIPPRPTHALDTTGAGDAHLAAMLAQLSQEADIYTAAHIANIAASLSVEKNGPATGPTGQELTAALMRYNMQQ